MNNVYKIIICFLTVIITIPLNGCWNQKELQERNFVMAIAVDASDEDKTGTFVQPHGDKRYRYSIQVLRLASGKEQGENKKVAASSTFVISNVGQSFFEMSRDMIGQVSKPLFYEYLQTIVISEDALKQGPITDILDFFIRDAEMRWRVRVYITSGKAREIIEFIPPNGEPGGIYLANIARLHTIDAHIPGARSELGYVTITIDNKAALRLPRIELKDKILKVGGAALFKKNKFVGYIDEYAVKGEKIINGQLKSGLITAPHPGCADKVLVFEVFVNKSDLKPHIEGNNIYFTLDVAMRGNLAEITGLCDNDTSDPQNLKKLEKIFAEEVKRNILYSFKACQDLEADVLGFGKKLKAYEPKTWEKIKDNWDDIFPTVSLIPSVNVTVSIYGEHT